MTILVITIKPLNLWARILSVVLNFFMAPILCPLKADASSRIGVWKWVKSLNNPAQNYQIMLSYETSGYIVNHSVNHFSKSG